MRMSGKMEEKLQQEKALIKLCKALAKELKLIMIPNNLWYKVEVRVRLNHRGDMFFDNLKILADKYS